MLSSDMFSERIVYSIKNKDGSDRWVWPVSSSKPLFLHFYHTSSFKAEIFAFCVQLIFSLRLTSLFFKKSTRRLPAFLGDQWAMFMGTIGTHQKEIILVEEDGKHLFLKKPIGVHAQQALENEKNALQWLHHQHVKNVLLPECTTVENGFYVQLGKEKQKVGPSTFNKQHTVLLGSLFATTENTQTGKELIAALPIPNEAPRLYGLLQKWIVLRNQLEESESYQVGFVHGDFTPWNMSLQHEGLYVFDWELSQNNFPKGFDAFHFVFQQSILVDRLPWNAIQIKLDNLIDIGLFDDKPTLEKYLKAYLLFNLHRYILQYSNQEVWHDQIYWLIQVWHDALDSCLKNQSQRSSFLLSWIDCMGQFKYASLKTDNQTIVTAISSYSDLDVVCNLSDIEEIILFCKQHPLVERLHLRKQAHMQALSIKLKNGEFVHLDLIHRLQRKGLEFLDVSKIMHASHKNPYGLQVASQKDSAAYVAYFYVLNNAFIPEAYKETYTPFVAQAVTKEQAIVKGCYEDKVKTADLKDFLKTHKRQSGLSLWLQKIKYGVYSFFQFFQGNGFIITFSGVDGAGKTTLINATKFRLEKFYRKEVIVIRHRPSLLPILSAWKHGKSKAESISIQNLPRQGTNKSVVSSIFRFLYYYLDYLIGQFFIYFKYIRRGKIVLYDRYYYDFIVDGKRSNIALSSKWVKRLYAWILSPKFNFFLYASPEVILARKQEMPSHDIVSLTRSYRTLFEDLQKRTSDCHYVSIENLDKEHSIELIFKTIHTHTLC